MNLGLFWGGLWAIVLSPASSASVGAEGVSVPLHAIAERFLPQLEHLFGQVSADGGNPHQMDVMVLILKIFFFLNYSGISPCLIQPGRIRPWIEFMVQILSLAAKR